MTQSHALPGDSNLLKEFYDFGGNTDLFEDWRKDQEAVDRWEKNAIDRIPVRYLRSDFRARIRELFAKLSRS